MFSRIRLPVPLKVAAPPIPPAVRIRVVPPLLTVTVPPRDSAAALLSVMLVTFEPTPPLRVVSAVPVVFAPEFVMVPALLTRPVKVVKFPLVDPLLSMVKLNAPPTAPPSMRVKLALLVNTTLLPNVIAPAPKVSALVPLKLKLPFHV